MLDVKLLNYFVDDLMRLHEVCKSFSDGMEFDVENFRECLKGFEEIQGKLFYEKI